jgi:hypothetical protein
MSTAAESHTWHNGSLTAYHSWGTRTDSSEKNQYVTCHKRKPVRSGQVTGECRGKDAGALPRYCGGRGITFGSDKMKKHGPFRDKTLHYEKTRASCRNRRGTNLRGWEYAGCRRVAVREVQYLPYGTTPTPSHEIFSQEPKIEAAA